MKAQFRIRVLVATTEGPVEIESLVAEDAILARSVVCIAGSTETAGIDREYHAFVDRGTGLIARLYGHDRFRLDVSGRVDAGSSWQLGVFIAHALHATGRLAHKGEEAGTVVLATGRVQPLDEAVLEVGHVDHKLRRAFERLQVEAINKSDILVVWPKANSLAVGEETRGLLRSFGTKVIEINSLGSLREALGLQNSTPIPSDGEIGSRRRRRLWSEVGICIFRLKESLKRPPGPEHCPGHLTGWPFSSCRSFCCWLRIILSP